jgi:hypothetical protein
MMLFHNVLHDAQTQSGSGPYALGSEEGLKYPFVGLFRDAFPIVGDRD